MPLTIPEARGDVMQLVKDTWDAGAETAGKVLIFEDSGQDRPRANVGDAVQLWGRAQIRHIDFFQATLGGETGNRRFRREAIMTLQVFTPQGEGNVRGYAIGQDFTTAMEGTTTPNGVIIRSVVVQEVGQDGPWFQTNVLANFEYDEVK